MATASTTSASGTNFASEAGTASYSASSGCEGDDGVILVWELRPQLQQKKKDD